MHNDITLRRALKEGGLIAFGQSLNVVFTDVVESVNVPNDHSHDFLKASEIFSVAHGLNFCASCNDA